MSSEVRVRDAVDRIMRIRSLIKMVPEQSISGTRSSVTKLLLEHFHLTEDELVAVGLKHLYQTDGPKKQQERDFGVDDTSKESFSDEQVLEYLAKAFGNQYAISDQLSTESVGPSSFMPRGPIFPLWVAKYKSGGDRSLKQTAAMWPPRVTVKRGWNS